MKDDSANTREWWLQRNCCLTPRQFWISYLVLCGLSFLVALVCTLHGLWQVCLFTATEMIGAAIAFLYYARHATDHEHIAVADGCLLIESVEAGEVKQTRLDLAATRIALPKRSRDLIHLEARGVRVDIGRHITLGKRRQVGAELKTFLQQRSLCMSTTLAARPVMANR